MTDGVITSLDFKRHIASQHGFRSDNRRRPAGAGRLGTGRTLSVAERTSEIRPNRSNQSAGVLAAVDLLRDGPRRRLSRPSGSLACVPVEQRHRPSHGSALTRRDPCEVGVVETSRAAPVAVLAVVVLAGELHAGSTAVDKPSPSFPACAEICGCRSAVAPVSAPRSLDRSKNRRSRWRRSLKSPGCRWGIFGGWFVAAGSVRA